MFKQFSGNFCPYNGVVVPRPDCKGEEVRPVNDGSPVEMPSPHSEGEPSEQQPCHLPQLAVSHAPGHMRVPLQVHLQQGAED